MVPIWVCGRKVGAALELERLPDGGLKSGPSRRRLFATSRTVPKFNPWLLIFAVSEARDRAFEENESCRQMRGLMQVVPKMIKLLCGQTREQRGPDRVSASKASI